MNPRCSAWCRKTSRRRRWSRRSCCSAGRSAGSRCATTRRAARSPSAAFLSTMVERTVTISVLLLHLVVLALGAYLATKGQITIGTFVTFESAFWEVSYNIAHIMHFIPVSIQSAAAVRHIQEMLDEPTRGADRPGAPDLPRITNDITFDRVTFKYEGSQTPVLDNLSLKLNVGKSIAIVGPSGSGKSTLLNLILRLYVPDEGRVTIDGVDIRKVTRESAAPQHGGGVPGKHAVQHVDPGEHPARQGGRDRRGGRRGRAQGRNPSLHHEPAAEIRHLGRRTRRYAVGRPAPAHRDRARHRARSRRSCCWTRRPRRSTRPRKPPSTRPC